MWFLLPTLQVTCSCRTTALHPQLTVVVVNHLQLTNLQNQNVTSKYTFEIFYWRRTEKIQVTRKTLMAKIGPRIMGFT
jgi:hypothetical protein